MNMENWSIQLGQILDCSVEYRSFVRVDLWDDIKETGTNSENQTDFEMGTYYNYKGNILLITNIRSSEVETLIFYTTTLTENEKQLIKIILIQQREEDIEFQYEGMSNHEKQATKLGQWLSSQMDRRGANTYIPDHLLLGSQLYNEMIPILLISDTASNQSSSYQELDKLLKSFLSDEILLIPLLNDEWLICGPLSLLKDDEPTESDSGDDETLEDSLSNIAHALHEMLASEWIGESHLAITYPVVPAKLMVTTAIGLRETLHIGRKFHIGTNIHLQWELQLERLIHSIPENERQKYLDQSLKRAELFVEPEMMFTLETFFSLDCNVSETAKKLYIHRNTLLYRIDKLKHETGLDVRLFRDAVLVKIILLLYKVTKTH